MKLLYTLIAMLFISSRAFAGGGGISTDMIDLLLQNQEIKAVAVEDQQYIDLLAKIGGNPISRLGDRDFNTSIWTEELVIQNGIPLIRSFDEDGQEFYFIGSSTLYKNFNNIAAPTPRTSLDFRRLLQSGVQNQISLPALGGGGISTLNNPNSASEIDYKSIWMQTNSVGGN